MSENDLLYCRVFVGITNDELRQMGIGVAEDITETLAVPFDQIRYVLSAGKYTTIRLKTDEQWTVDASVDDVFTKWCEWQKRNPGR